MAVQIFQEAKGKFGVLTDCDDERDFIEQFSLCAAEAVVRHAHHHIDGATEMHMTNQADFETTFRPAIEPGAADLAAMLSRAVEIICKYRGYKSLVKERKELFAGDAFPSLGDEGAAYSVAVENDEEA